MSDDTQLKRQMYDALLAAERERLSISQVVERLVSVFDIAEKPEPPACKFCGADCSDGRNWNGGDDYECPRCAEAKLELRNVLVGWQTADVPGQLLQAGWRRPQGSEDELYGDLEHDGFCWSTDDDWKLRAVAKQLWNRGWRR